MRCATFPPLRAVVVATGLILTVLLAATGLPIHANAAPPPEEHPGSPAAQPSSDALKKEFSEVIEGQLAAFRAGDYAKAYTFAASPIKGMFPAEDFETMVKNAYPVIAKSTAAEFGLAFDVGDEAVINVRIENADKKSILYQYMLQKEDGKWKISGVAEVKSSSLSV